MRPSALDRGFALGILRDLLEFCGKLVPGKERRPRARPSGVLPRMGLMGPMRLMGITSFLV